MRFARDRAAQAAGSGRGRRQRRDAHNRHEDRAHVKVDGGAGFRHTLPSEAVAESDVVRRPSIVVIEYRAVSTQFRALAECPHLNPDQ